MSWPGDDNIVERWLRLLFWVKKSLVFCHWVTIEWTVHHFLWVRMIISWPWVLVSLDKREALNIFSTYREGKPLPFLVFLLCIIIEIIDQSRCVPCSWGYFCLNVKDDCLLSNPKARCLFAICGGNVIKVIQLICLCFHFGLF